MGDHRAYIKIEMEFHGIKDKTTLDINYFPSDCCGMDESVIEFFNSVYERGMKQYNREIENYFKERGKQKELEKKEFIDSLITTGHVTLEQLKKYVEEREKSE